MDRELRSEVILEVLFTLHKMSRTFLLLLLAALVATSVRAFENDESEAQQRSLRQVVAPVSGNAVEAGEDERKLGSYASKKSGSKSYSKKSGGYYYPYSPKSGSKKSGYHYYSPKSYSKSYSKSDYHYAPGSKKYGSKKLFHPGSKKYGSKKYGSKKSGYHYYSPKSYSKSYPKSDYHYYSPKSYSKSYPKSDYHYASKKSGYPSKKSSKSYGHYYTKSKSYRDLKSEAPEESDFTAELTNEAVFPLLEDSADSETPGRALHNRRGKLLRGRGYRGHHGHKKWCHKSSKKSKSKSSWDYYYTSSTSKSSKKSCKSSKSWWWSSSWSSSWWTSKSSKTWTSTSSHSRE